MKFIVDIDGTICTITNGDYSSAKPFLHRIHQLNKLYDDGHEIHYWTARGSGSGLNWKELTTNQLERWGCKYHSLKLGKPSYDVWIDDKSEHPASFFDDCP